MILGITPGTRSCGFAVVREKEIRKWGVQSFKGKWSDGKLISILYGLSKLMTRHRIREVAIKIPDTMPRSIGYAQLLGAMNALFEQRGITVRYFTLSDLTREHAPKKKINRQALFVSIVDLYPELLPLFRKEQKAKKPYYDKVFEAVASAHGCKPKK